MPNRTAAPLLRTVAPPLLRAAGVTALLAPWALVPGGCKGEERATPATAPTPATTAQASFEGVTFEHPADWKVTALPDGKGVNVAAPEDAGWEPNVFLEVQPSPDGKALDELITSNIELLGARKQDFRVRGQSQVDHPNGFRYGRIEYANASEGSPSVPLTQWSVIVPLPGQPRRLQVQTAAATAVWDKYRPRFEAVIDSIKLPRR